MERLTHTENAIYTASTYLLDACGIWYGLERKWGESDEDFRKRLLHKIRGKEDEAWEPESPIELNSRLEDTLNKLVKVKVKPERLLEVAAYLPFYLHSKLEEGFEVRDVGYGYHVGDKVLTKLCFDRIQEEPNEMSRDNITNKGSEKPKSEWFGYKYRVNPETSKLLQEAVFKDGGRWAGSRGTTLMGTYMEYIYVTHDGIMSYGNGSGTFNKNTLPEKEPPQPYKIKWNSCVDHGGVKVKDYFELTLPESNIQPSKTLNEQFNDLIKRLKTTDSKNGVYWSGAVTGRPIEKQQWVSDRSDVKHYETLNTHKPHGLCEEISLTSKPIECTIQLPGAVKSIEVNLTNFLNQQEESNMSNANRRVVNVKLLDNDSGLPVENALVAQFDNIVTEDSNDVVVQEILLNKNIADAIAKHNQKRVEQTDLEILKRTGNDVKLRQVKLKDLTWLVTTA